MSQIEPGGATADFRWLFALGVALLALVSFQFGCCGDRGRSGWCKKALFKLDHLLPVQARENWRREIEQAEGHYVGTGQWSKVLRNYWFGFPKALAAEWKAWWHRRRRLKLLLRCEFEILSCSRPISNAELRRLWCERMINATRIDLASVLENGWVDLSVPEGELVLTVRVRRLRRRSRGRHRAR